MQLDQKTCSTCDHGHRGSTYRRCKRCLNANRFFSNPYSMWVPAETELMNNGYNHMINLGDNHSHK